MTSRIRIAGAAATGASLLAFGACVREPELSPLEPMGRLPGLVTTAEPEWIPFQVAAGTTLPEDAREERLAEPRAIDVGGQARRMAWAADGRSLLAEVKRLDAPCEAAWQIPLGRQAPKLVSGPGTRARIGAVVGPDRFLIAESPCSEPSASAKWAIVEVDVATNKRRVVARPDGEAFGLTFDGSTAFFAVRGGGAKRDRIERVAIAGGTPVMVADCNGLDAGSVARATLVFGCREKENATQLVSASDQGGNLMPWSGGDDVDLDAALTADGRTLAFASARALPRKGQRAAEGPFQIYVAPLSSREVTHPATERLTFAGDNNRAPAFGPAGRIAYLSDRGAPGGPLGVVVARFDAP